MDVWFVAAAAGAGYVAQCLKNLNSSKHRRVSLESSAFPPKLQDKSSPLHRVLSSEIFGEDNCTEREKACQNASDSEMASTNEFEGENLVAFDNVLSCSSDSNSISLAGVLNNEDIEGDWEGRISADIDAAGDLFPQPSSREVGFSYDFRRNISSLRSRRFNSQFIKSRTSLESCLMAHLYKECTEIENYIYSVRGPHQPTVRPLLVSDESRIINKELHESSNARTSKYKLQKDAYSQDNNTMLGVPRLPNVIPAELQKRAKAKTGKKDILTWRNSGKMVNGSHNIAQGSSDGVLHFYLGLTMGMISSFVANRKEMEKLNWMLKQTENLVQDLQEELEMKDSLTVKELAVEDYESQEEYCDGRAKEESLSKIEAELEAELERLESNINSSRLEGKLSNVTELDPDFASDVIKGELRADLFDAKTGTQPYADGHGSNGSIPPPPSVQYPVSPRELSLRLHEVIQSRLEDRIMELETALQNSQREVKYLDSKHMCQQQFSNNKTTSFSIRGSPIAGEEQSVEINLTGEALAECSKTTSSSIRGSPIAGEEQSVEINLTGEALAECNAAFKELMKASESGEEDLPFGFEKSNHQELFDQCKQDIDPVHNDGSNSYMERHSYSNGYLETTFNHNFLNDVVYTCSEESEDGGVEMERRLIRQIVEKARKGSPVILNAEKALLSTDENKN